MPAAAVNPAPIVYTKIVAVKTFVVELKNVRRKLDTFQNSLSKVNKDKISYITVIKVLVFNANYCLGKDSIE